MDIVAWVAFAGQPETIVIPFLDTPGGRAEADDVEDTRQGEGDEDAPCEAPEADGVDRHARRAGRRSRHYRHCW